MAAIKKGLSISTQPFTDTPLKLTTAGVDIAPTGIGIIEARVNITAAGINYITTISRAGI
jgi:hypothetical protein